MAGEGHETGSLSLAVIVLQYGYCASWARRAGGSTCRGRWHIRRSPGMPIPVLEQPPSLYSGRQLEGAAYGRRLRPPELPQGRRAQPPLNHEQPQSPGFSRTPSDPDKINP